MRADLRACMRYLGIARAGFPFGESPGTWYFSMMIVFLDIEFTDFIEPALLSLGAVSLDGHEHYVELDMSTEIGQARLKASSDFVRYDGVLDMFGPVPGASATYEERIRRS